MTKMRDLDQDKMLKSIKEFVIEMNQCTTKEQIYGKLASWVSRLTNAERASVTLADQSAAQFEVFGLSGDGGLLPIGKMLPIDGSVAGIAFKQREVLRFDFADHRDAVDCQMLSQQGLVACINAPLSIDGSTIGTINIATSQSADFDESARHVMETLASMVSSSLSRYDLLQKLKDAALKLRSQASFMRLIATSSSELSDAEGIDDLFYQTSLVIDELTQIETVRLFEVDVADGAVVHSSTYRDGKCAAVQKALRIRLSELEKLPLLAPVSTVEVSGQQKHDLARTPLRSLGHWILPINVTGRTEFLLGIKLESEAPFGVDLLEPFSILSNILGATLDRIRARAKVEEKIYHDELTGLLNRAGFNQRLSALLAADGSSQFALIIADLNNFKLLNDQHGHWTGNAALKAAARLLEELTGPESHVCRIGGDEFAILAAQETPGECTRERVIERLNECKLAIQADGEEVEIRFSLGAAFHPEHASDAGALLKHADLAMYRAKRAKHRHVQIFDPYMADEFDRRAVLRHEFHKAALTDEIVPHYHPLINLFTGKVEGVEALARWNHAQRGLLTPTHFEFIFDDRELKALLARRMVDCIVDDICTWRGLGVPYESVGLNLEITDLEDASFLQYVRSKLDERNIPARELAFEITENSQLDIENGILIEQLQKVRAAGMYIALDDFGTGYSSLTHVKDLPLTALKLDKSFVHNITSSDSDYVIAQCLMEMARGLGVKSIAEGIESPEQLAVLKALNCDMGQGYLFAHPLPAHEMPKLIANLNAIGSFTMSKRHSA